MIPLWMFPYAATCGNAIVMKPSERVPLTTMKLLELLHDPAYGVNLPPGIVNCIHGTHDAVNFILDDEDIKSVSFVGSNGAGEYIYRRAAETFKRAQVNMGEFFIFVLFQKNNFKILDLEKCLCLIFWYACVI